MFVSEFQRHEVFKWLEEQMGPERAAMMMDLLPPVGWGDIVTRTDLRTEVGAVRADIGALRAEMHAASSEMLLKLFFGMVASNATLVGLVLAAVRLG